MARSRANRRNTLDCALLNEIFIDDDTNKKNDKRSIQLLRESERDMKRSSGIIYPTALTPSGGSPNKNILNNNTNIANHSIPNNTNSIEFEERAESFPALRMCVSNNLSVVPKLIESCNRYMSVASRPIGCRASAPPLAYIQKDSAANLGANVSGNVKMMAAATNQNEKSMLQTRLDFHDTFANLIKLGSLQESKISNEDYTWQTELKDMIWLELQAWHADRTLEQQDKYLYTARQGIPDLLRKILNYK